MRHGERARERSGQARTRGGGGASGGKTRHAGSSLQRSCAHGKAGEGGESGARGGKGARGYSGTQSQCAHMQRGGGGCPYPYALHCAHVHTCKWVSLPVWVPLCMISLDRSMNRIRANMERGHKNKCAHVHGVFLPVCVPLCMMRLDRSMNRFSHSSHAKGVSPARPGPPTPPSSTATHSSSSNSSRAREEDRRTAGAAAVRVRVREDVGEVTQPVARSVRVGKSVTLV